jgi:uncharacterized protein (TIGR02611 family)
MNKVKKHTKKVVISIAGFAILAAGLIMLVTPGPGWVFIILGLGILATEYAWANNLLQKAKNYYEKVKDKALRKKTKKPPAG